MANRVNRGRYPYQVVVEIVDGGVIVVVLDLPLESLEYVINLALILA